MRCFRSWLIFCSLVFASLVYASGQNNSLLDSLKQRKMETPTTTDPVTYEDDATFGTYKPLHPPSADEPLDSKHQLQKGWRVRITTVTTQDSANYYLKSVAKKLSVPTQLLIDNDKYEILCGNYTELPEARTAATAAYRAGYPYAVPVESWVMTSEQKSVTDTTQRPLDDNICWQVQVAAMRTKFSADSLATILRTLTKESVEVVLPSDRVWRVRVGKARTSEEASKLRDTIRDLGYKNAWLTTTEIK